MTTEAATTTIHRLDQAIDAFLATDHGLSEQEARSLSVVIDCASENVTDEGLREEDDAEAFWDRVLGSVYSELDALGLAYYGDEGEIRPF